MSHLYTAYLAWYGDDGKEVMVEEFDFVSTETRSTKSLIADAVEVAARNYLPGFKVVGLVDVNTNEVLYNPTDAPTRTEWFVTF